MKSNLLSNTLLALAVGGLLYALAANPPGHASWSLFLTDPASWPRKLLFLGQHYVWPGLLAFLAILLFQLQFRLASSGASGRLVFPLCLLASTAMFAGFRAVATNPGAEPMYIAGMALAYTTMSRLYAMRLRTFFGKVRIPWPIWRGNLAAMQEIDRQVKEMTRARMQPRP